MSELTDEQKRVAEQVAPNDLVSRRRDETTDARFTITPDKQGQSNGDGRTEEPEVGAHSMLVPPDTGKSGRGAGLEQHENKDHEAIKLGHLLDKHIDKTDAQLIDRFKGPEPLTKEFSSAFTDRATAEAVAAKTIADPDNQAKLQKWTENGQQGNLRLMYNGNPETPIGRGIRQDGTVVPMHDARVVLKSEGNGNWFILTGYPEKR